MNTTDLYGPSQLAATLALIGGNSLGTLRNDLIKQAIVAAANKTGGGGGGESGTVTAFAFTNANGITGVVTTPNTTPTLVISLGAITPTSVNGLKLTAAAAGFTLAGGTASKTLTVSNTLTLAGTDSSTLNIGAGGTLGTAAFTAASAYVPAASVTGGGVIAAGGFTLTVPATGTAALLGTAQTFSNTNTFATGSISANTPSLLVTQTWNNAAINFVAVKIAVTTTNNAASELFSVYGGSSGTTAALKVISSAGSVGVVCSSLVSAANTWSLDYFVNGLAFGNTRTLFWSSTVNYYDTADTGLTRGSAGVVKVTNGSSGYGVIDASGHSASGTAGVTAGPFTVITSITVKGGIVTALTGS
jgi:hypothetical protein